MSLSTRQTFTMLLLGLGGLLGGKAAAQTAKPDKPLPVDPVVTHLKNYAGSVQFSDTDSKRLYFVGKKELTIMRRNGTNRFELGMTLKDSKYGIKRDTIDLYDDVQSLTYIAEAGSDERVMVDMMKGKGSIMSAKNFSTPQAAASVSNAEFEANFEAGTKAFNEKYGTVAKAVQEAQQLYGLPDLLTTSNLKKIAPEFISELGKNLIDRAELGPDGTYMHVEMDFEEEGHMSTVVYDKNGDGLFGNEGDALGYTLFDIPNGYLKGKTVFVDFINNAGGLVKTKDGKTPAFEEVQSPKAQGAFKENFPKIEDAAQALYSHYGVRPPKTGQ